MSEEVAKLTGHVVNAVSEVNAALAKLVEGVAKLEGHELDLEAHGILNPDSPFRRSLATAVSETIFERDGAQEALNQKIEMGISDKLPGVLDAELAKTASQLNAAIKAAIDRVLDEKIKSGDLDSAALVASVRSIVSDAVNSASSETIASSKAVKAAYDKACLADDKARTAETDAANAVVTANSAKSVADQAKTAATTAGNSASAAKNTADTASANASAAKTTANTAKSTADAAKTTADAAKTAANGAIPKTGKRGQLSGSESAADLSGSQTITIASADCVNLATSGATALAFTPAAAMDRAVKVLCLTAAAETALAITGAVWANNGSAPDWGAAGKRLVLLAHFAAGLVILSVIDNNQ